MKKTIWLCSLIILAFGMIVPAATADVWEPPPGNPPSSNRPRPLDVSAEAQTKAGDLTVQGTLNVESNIATTVGAPTHNFGDALLMFSPDIQSALFIQGNITRDEGLDQGLVVIENIDNTANSAISLLVNNQGTAGSVALQVQNLNGGWAGYFYGPVGITGGLQVDTNTFYVDAANNLVGIGTTEPQLTLHIKSDTGQTGIGIDSIGTGSVGTVRFTTGAGGSSGGDGGGALYWYANNNFTSTRGGLIFRRVSIPTVAEEAGDWSMAFTTSNNDGLGTEKMRITGNGKVGIGTTIPIEELEVVGQIKADNFRTDEITSHTVFVGDDAGINSSGNNSTFVGEHAGEGNTGANSSAVGYYALRSNTGANSNAMGYAALQSNTGVYSNAIGRAALQNNTGANSNAMGYAALQNNTGGSSNAIGHYALQNNIAIFSNAIGFYTLQNNTGTYSNAMGYYALQNNTGASSNAIGSYALRYNAGANSNAMGSSALQYNAGANSNAIGSSALIYNAGAYSSAMGYYALRYNAGANSNAMGSSALQYNNSTFNTALGHESFNTWTNDPGNAVTFDYTDVDAGTDYITVTGHGLGAINANLNLKFAQGTSGLPGVSNGSYNQFKVIDANTLKIISDNITGQGTGVGHTLTPKVNYTNSTALGYNAEPDASNQVILGNMSVTQVKTTGAIYSSGAGDSYFGGDIGIGIIVPGYRLDVQGQVNASGGFCIAGDCIAAWPEAGGGAGLWTDQGTYIQADNNTGIRVYDTTGLGIYGGLAIDNDSDYTVAGDGDLVVWDGLLRVCDGDTCDNDLANDDGDLYVEDDIEIDGGLCVEGGATCDLVNGGDVEIEDGSVCIGDSGCEPPAGDGNLLVEGNLTVGGNIINDTGVAAVQFTGGNVIIRLGQ